MIVQRLSPNVAWVIVGAPDYLNRFTPCSIWVSLYGYWS
ncbi:hypothetical protein PS893_01731 [Pseudomonas fluorescens]|jgi:hypothetical protein|uniref:Uncharacterized protein n=1 Tax=Pseudomonas fluorescens TaxID=294 RepID=A0A5E7J9Q5_PSEFL|nr:hypothetical protein PS647_01863 [Pseudomonas fluorescens]VVN13076.1 hypothetical protein PS673_03901 [Pseudomonas fluorescens]VVO79933.1 hypothetical protein PS893_01731 [Pseudomonas fluorescens]VVP24207.1 hypothetical protein PS843_03945 [Pseudomonas fluorescens]